MTRTREKTVIYINWLFIGPPDNRVKPVRHSRRVDSRELAKLILNGEFGLRGNKYVDQDSIEFIDYTGMKEF